MTGEHFRKLALALPGAEESAHLSHPDFRVGGRIFASLGYPDAYHGMVKLPLELQRKLVQQAPAIFKPCNGAWGRQGCTSVHLATIQREQLETVLKAAFDCAAKHQMPKPRRAGSLAARKTMARR